MKQNTKILLITFGIFFGLVAVVCLCFLGGKLFFEHRTDKAFDEHISQAKINAMAHLSEKYPEKTFEIINVKCDTPDEGIPVTRVPNWNAEVWFEIKDNEGGIFVVKTDTTKFGTDGIACTQDNVQTNEIDAAIKEKLQDILGIDAEYMKKYSRTGAMYYLYHEKYTGDIVEFANRATEKNVYFEIYCFNKKLDATKITKDNAEFFKLFDNIFIAETTTEITTDMLKHRVFEMGKPEDAIPELAYSIEKVYRLDENHQIISHSTKMADYSDYLYTKPYQNFEEQEPTSIDLFYVDVGQWLPKIGELETQTGKVYSNITPITNMQIAMDGFVYFVPYDMSQLQENQTLLLLTFIDSFQTPEYIAYEIGEGNVPKHIVNNYIYIGSMNPGIQWLIAVADLGHAPVRVTE